MESLTKEDVLDIVAIYDDIDKYIEEYYRICTAEPDITCQEAYEKIEQRILKIFRRRRYSSYESFRKMRNRRQKKD